MESETPRTDAIHNELVKQSELPDWIVGKAYVDMRKHARQLERELREAREEEEKKLEQEWLGGYLCACQFLVVGHGEDRIAEDAIIESGFTQNDFLKAQKRNGFETRRMNAVIREAYDRVARIEAHNKK